MYGRVRVNTLPGHEKVLDIYSVDKYGNVYTKDGVELKQRDNGKGYMQVGLKVDGERRWQKCYAHRLCALAFVKNENPDLYYEIDHIDGNRKNNFYKNLRWVNRKKNMENPVTVERMQGIGGIPCSVYDFQLNFIGDFKSLFEAGKAINRAVPGVNVRVKEYYVLEDHNLSRVLSINRKQKLQSVVITDIITNEKMYFYSNREARRFFHGRVNITDAINKNWTVKGRYKIRVLNYKKLIGMLDL